jgi:formylglycine-generating enzyme required for sulfatase activity
MLQPMEYHASTSEVVQILNKGHHNVRLDAEAWQRLHTWMDLNVPYHATWAETRGGKVGAVGDRFREMQKLYANVETNPEAMPPMPTTRPAFVQPKPEAPDVFTAPQVPGWPFDAAEAAQRQARLGPEATKAIPLGMTREWKDTITCKTTPPVPVELKLAHIPPGEFAMGDAAGDRDAKPMTRVKIDKPFWMATVEVTNAMYSLFDPRHDSRYVDMELKDQEVPGYHADLPDQPVIRVSWQEALGFCEWLSRKTGMRFTLPTEAQWEWACRAGTATPMWFGAVDADFGAFANFSDVNVKKFALSGFRPQIQKDPSPYHAFIPKIETVDDKHQIQAPVGFYKANPWGLYDMHGNVSEWTRSLYKPYPYDEVDGRNDLAAPGQRVVRGGSWFDRPKRGTSAFRLPYEAYQKVHNVGFRVVAEEGAPAAVAAARK